MPGRATIKVKNYETVVFRVGVGEGKRLREEANRYGESKNDFIINALNFYAAFLENPHLEIEKAEIIQLFDAGSCQPD